jgi:hypothetical protein
MMESVLSAPLKLALALELAPKLELALALMPVLQELSAPSAQVP